MLEPITLAALLLAINAVAILAFWHDKRRAVAGGRRIPEANLLFLALIGGSPGAMFATRQFRHKTRKEPFRTLLLIICALQLGAVIGFAIF